MININAQNIFIALQKLIAITIVFHKPYQFALCEKLLSTKHYLSSAETKLIAIIIVFHQCAIISVITSNIPSHGWNCNRLLRHFTP